MPDTDSSLDIPARYVQVNGFNVHYVEIGTGFPVLLLHGLGGSLQDWSENIHALSRAFKVYALNLPGFGASPAPTVEIMYSLGYAANFVRAFINSQCLERVFLIGNSMGGGISLKFAIDYPERSAGLILANSVGIGKEIAWLVRILSLPGVAKLALRSVSRQKVRQIWESLFVNPAYATEERVEHTWRWVQKPSTREFLGRVYANAATIWGQKEILLPDLSKIESPILILWGANDKVLPASHAYRAHQYIPNSLVHIIPQCGHVPQIEQAAEFNRLALEFMKKIDLGQF